jgi:ferritin-like protein
VADSYDSGALEAADALRMEAHQLRETSRALARQALEARTSAKIIKQRARAALIVIEETARVNAELRKTVEALAARLRELGVGPETVVMAVKGISNEAAQTAVVPLRPAERLALTNDLVQWAVEAYYAA